MTGIASSPDLKSHIRADWKQAHNIWKNVVLSGFVEVALIPSGGGGTIILKSDGKTLQWTKIGRQITVTGNIWVDDVLEGPTGHLDITGLPGPVGEGYSYYSAVSLYGRNLEWGTDVVVLQGYVYNDGGQTKIRVSRLHQGEEHELFAHEIIAGSQLRISATYFLEGVSSDTFGFTGIASGVAHDLLSPRHGDTVPGAVVKGALPYGNATPKWAALAPNATATKKYLSMTSSVPTWEELAAGDIPAHQLDGAKHTVSGLTPGHFLKALTATTFGFAAHGLTYSDVGAAAAGHDHSGVYEPVISAGSSAQYYRGDKTWQTLNQAAVDGLKTTDSPVFVTGKFSALTDGYIPYHVSDVAGLANSPIYINGNLIGVNTVDLEAWHASFPAIEFPQSAIIYGASSRFIAMLSNAYYSTGWKYKVTGAASMYYQDGGTCTFRVAVSGNANDPITWMDAFIVSNHSSLLIGGVGPTYTEKLAVVGVNGGIAGIYLNDATPSITTATLYRSGNDLYWGTTKLN